MEENIIVKHLEESKREIDELAVISINIVDMIFRLKGNPETFNSDQSDLMFGLQTLVSNHLEILAWDATMVADVEYQEGEEKESSFFDYIAELNELLIMSKSVIDMGNSPQISFYESPVDSERAEMMFNLQIVLSDHIHSFVDEVDSLYHGFYGAELNESKLDGTAVFDASYKFK
ncbi:hypothetical protein FC70_GL000199 [Paucilactobacillus oligofermentans DSM 15707 = LMG 22743]|uniref:Uncharacterized protein n=1 Tax=Paucilactobacillus oligofermentans DSM 15707 = LMG 22743 TaxID=1423778 RepID=A0A0R1RME1_9LACO|nr:hypothetical protein [Paucilactobacillus oligofermentans]KRL57729.1 hypothetical protein FC70_GL000199 [Paucilactobacillus oligofermentans DSM 15707 = LMG 22743]CUS26825.1 Uncharacterized protein LACOL_1495 [Paucilactobacillus oligofermentans DSM 15707 = LMG 22743]